MTMNPPATPDTGATDVIDALRHAERKRPPLLFRGFGPLLVVALLLIAMMLLLPSVAPERIVSRPASNSQTQTPAP